MEIEYRKSSTEDIENLAKFRNTYSDASLEKDRETFGVDFGPNRDMEHVLFVATINSKIVGYGRCGFFDPVGGNPIYGLLSQVPRGYYLKGVLTDESVRGKGVGKQLTLLREDWVRKKEREIYCVLQNANLTSLKMHEGLGYKIVKSNLPYQGLKDDRSGLLLKKIL